jgi:cysteine-rich repeat protein
VTGRPWVGALLFALGCGRSTLPFCGDGRLDPWEACDDGNTSSGDGCNAVCQPEPTPACGDGRLDPGEGCDDANREDGDGCSHDCRVEYLPHCGDGLLDFDEECDDGNLGDHDGCSHLCRRERPPSCGDARLDLGEECDDGNLVDRDGCDRLCRFEISPTCGDGILGPSEACDDGNRTAGDGCDQFCRLEVPPSCGDGRVNTGEACDDGNRTAGDGCDQFCRLEPPPSCGDGVLDPAEECDDGQRSDGDGCDRLCRLEPCRPDAVLGTLPLGTAVTRPLDLSQAADRWSACGAGPEAVVGFELPVRANLVASVTRTHEVALGLYRNVGSRVCTDELVRCGYLGGTTSVTFDDLAAGSYYLVPEATPESLFEPLSYTLTAEVTAPRCGDGRLDPGEICDDGNSLSGDGCSSDCRSNEVCGNRVVDQTAGEVCDNGNQVSGDGCSADCQSDETCGNGIVDGLEACDDGNHLAGDGCSTSCDSTESCGNGRIDPGEKCDDGNQLPGDGCSADCQSDETCGNGIVDGLEACDDGNRAAGDGCSDRCEVEVGVCRVDQDWDTLGPGAPVELSVDVSAYGNNWTTSCGSNGREYVVTFNLDRTSDVTVGLEQSSPNCHSVGLYRAGEVTETCEALRGLCSGTTPGSGLRARFLERQAGIHYLIVESRTFEEAGPVRLSVAVEGCAPSPDLGVLLVNRPAAAQVVTTNGSATYRTTCQVMSGRESVLAFELALAGSIELDWIQTGDHAFGLFAESGSSCDASPVACAYSAGQESGRTTFGWLSAGQYLLIVDAAGSGSEGSVALTLVAR